MSKQFASSLADKAPTTRPSSVLDHRVQVALKDHPHLKRRNLRFETSEGRVVLRGVSAPTTRS